MLLLQSTFFQKRENCGWLQSLWQIFWMQNEVQRHGGPLPHQWHLQRQRLGVRPCVRKSRRLKGDFVLDRLSFPSPSVKISWSILRIKFSMYQWNDQINNYSCQCHPFIFIVSWTLRNRPKILSHYVMYDCDANALLDDSLPLCWRHALTTSVTTSSPSATPWPQTLERSILGSARLWKSEKELRDRARM